MSSCVLPCVYVCECWNVLTALSLKKIVSYIFGAGENLGFTSYPPPILSKKAKGKNLLLGANFASGGSGYYETTAEIYV